MNNNLKNIKGITLIALVITIIVLLILAGVSIAMLTGQNGILTQAQNAKQTTELKSAEEKVKLAVMATRSQTEAGTLDADKLIAEITNNYGGTATKTNNDFPVNATVDGNNFIIDVNGNVGTKQDRTGLKVGDYINYKPDTAEGKTYSLLGTQSGHHSDQIISQENLNWRILKINDDGSIDIISDLTNNKIYFNGALGYNNGVYLLNDICKELYSNISKGVTARSVNLKDMEDWLTDAGKLAKDTYVNGDGIKYGETKTYTGEYSYTPGAYNLEEDENSNYYTSPTTKTYTKLGTLNAKKTYYNIPVNETNYGDGAKLLSSPIEYWIATRHVECFSNQACFGLRSSNRWMGGSTRFTSSNVEGDYNGCLRAVVTLGSNVQITENTGNDVAHAHTIEW